MPFSKLSPAELQKVILNAIKRGPTRVIVSRDGHAVPPGIALKDYCLVPDVIFVRADGWTLGAPTQFAKVAYAIWADEWVTTVSI